jgi:putative ABC transport system permease protein
MGVVWRATINGVLARKVRLLLTALAVVLGVAFATGTYVLTDTLHQSVQQLFSQYTAGSDLIVQFHEPFAGGGGTRERIPEGVVTDVRGVRGVDAATGFVQGDAKFVAKDGKGVIQTAGFPTLGISWSGGDTVGPAKLLHGRAPKQGGEVAMDEGTAKRNGFRVGDHVRVVATQAPASRFTIVGTFGLGNRSDLGVFSVAAFDKKTTQRLFTAEGLVDWVNVRVKDGESVSTVQRALADRLGPQFDVERASAVATQLRQPADEFLTILNYVLLAFAAAGVLVGGFIIFNTFTILVTQRTRELGLLRAMGASGPQVVGSVLAEAFAMGVVASVIGFVAGIGLAKLLLMLLPHFGFHVVVGPLRVLQRTALAAALVGIGATVLAAIYPALRAARTPPVAAINELRTAPGPRPLVLRAILGGLVILTGIGIGIIGLVGDLSVQYSVAVTFVGGFVIFVGIVVLGPMFARQLSSWIGRPLPGLLGVTGTLARGNAMRNPRRTSATAAALIVGLALVALVAIFADSFRTSVRGAIDDVRADFVITSPEFAGFSTRVADEVRSVKGVERAVAFRFDTARIGTNDEIVNGATVNGLDDVIDLRFTSGGTAGLARNGILVSDTEADHYGVKVGDQLPVQFPRTGPQALPVSGIFRTRRFSGAFPIDFIVSDSAFQAGFGSGQQDTLLYVKAADGDADHVGSALRSKLARPFPNVEVKTRDEFLAAREQTISQFLDIFIALLLLSELIAVLGIINTLMLSVYERTRELGLLRTVGTTRGQIWTMVCGESVIIAVIGCFVGIGVGLLWGWGVTTALRGQFVDDFSVPPAQIAWFVVASVIAGLLAALLPAWHASRLDVLEAVAQE